MPKQTRIKKNKQTAPTQQDTYRYRQGIEPSARPTHIETRVRPKAQGASADIFIDAMANLKDSMKAGAGIIDFMKKEDREKGKLAQAKGEKPAGDETTAWLEGYEQMKGAGEGYNQLSALLAAHYEEHSAADPRTFNKTQDEVIRDFMSGRSDSYLKGILPGAEQLVAEYQGAFIKQKQEEFHLDKLTTVRNLMDAEITKLLKGGGTAEDIRNLLNETHKFGDAALGLSKMEISAQLVDLLGNRAVDYANPALLQAVQVPDKDGVRLIDNPKLAKKINQYEKAANVEATRRATAAMKQREKAIKEIKADLTSNMSELLVVAGTGTAADRMKAAKAIQEVLFKYGDASRNKYGIELDAKDIEHYHEELLVLSGGDGNFAMQTNLDAFNAAYTIAKTNPDKLTPERMDALKPLLERDEYEEIIKVKAQTYESRRRNGMKKSTAEKRWESGMKKTLATLSKADKIWGPLFDNGAERAELGESLGHAAWDKFTIENRRQPNLKEQWEMRVEIKKMVDDMIPAIPRKDLSPEGKKRAMEFINPGMKSSIIEEDSIKSGFKELQIKPESAKETALTQGD